MSDRAEVVVVGAGQAGLVSNWGQVLKSRIASADSSGVHTRPMSDRAEVVVVGAGQAGLAVSYELTRAHVAHVVLEKGRVGESWRGRWDSFCLVTPNWSLQLPGHPYGGQDADGFMLRDDVVGYLERYAAGFEAPVRTASRSGR